MIKLFKLKNIPVEMTLTRLMLAMALLASAFIPIMGVMGTSMKATDKDDRTIRAVNICQEKMNRALQFPFWHFRATSQTVNNLWRSCQYNH